MGRITRREWLQGAAALGALPAVLTTARSASGAAVRSNAAPASVAEPTLVVDAELAERERHRLDFDWRFHLGHASDAARDFGWGTYQRTFAKAGSNTALAAQLDFDDADWQSVQVPHDWAVALPFAPSSGADAAAEEDPRAAHGYKPLGREYPDTSIGWYRLKLAIPASDLGRRITLEFDGVFRDCLVFCNGHVITRNESGYAPFSVELSDFLDYGTDNLICVRVDATLGEGWFYEGAGIYRPVYLVKTDRLHIPQWGVQVRSEVSGSLATLHVTTELANDSEVARSFRLEGTILGPDGRSVARIGEVSGLLGAGERRTLQQSVQLQHPALWSVDQPQLYRLVSRLGDAQRIVDATSTSFGVRTLRFDPEQGFFLNGRHVKLQGTCNHQDHAGVGTALPDALIEWRVQRLKEMGSNAYRSAHNPPSAALLDACDRLGMLVIDEVRLMSSAPEAQSQLERMIRRDRNHPCVILWSLGNEEPQMITARGARIVRSMKRLANRLDPTRLTTFAMDKGFGSGVAEVVDVLGFNYRTDQMGEYHARRPQQPLIGTETGSTVGTRGIYVRDEQKGFVRAYDLDYPWWASSAEGWWDYAERRSFIGGGFVWTGFDYRGEPTPYNRYPNISSQFGILDTCGFPKDNFYYYQARWRSEPVLHLLPHWNWPQPGQIVEVWCHSNLEEVELLLNGVSQGRHWVPRNGHAQWQVPYVPGVIEARGYRGNRLVLSTRRETADAPARIALSATRTRLRVDGNDVAMVRCEIQDAQGRYMPLGDAEVQFAVSGPAAIIGVGNGDPTSLEADKAERRRAFNGLCQVIVQAGRQAGSVQVSASAAGLTAGTLAIDVAHEVDAG